MWGHRPLIALDVQSEPTRDSPRGVGFACGVAALLSLLMLGVKSELAHDATRGEGLAYGVAVLLSIFISALRPSRA